MAALIGAQRARDHLHLRRHRGQQPGAARRGARGRARAGRARTRTHRQLAHRAQVGARHLRAARARRFRGHAGRARRERARAARSRARGAARRHAAGVADAGQQRDRRDQRHRGIAAVCRARGVLLHTDASQAVGQTARRRRARSASISCRSPRTSSTARRASARCTCARARGRRSRRIQFGGGHERGLRSGTLPTHQIVGFGVAAALARARGRARRRPCARSRARACGASSSRCRASILNGTASSACRACVNVSFEGVEGESLSPGLPGSRCRPARPAAPPLASRATCCARWAASTELAQSSLRLSLGRFTTAADVDAAATAIRARSRAAARAGGRRAARASSRAALRRDAAPAESLLARTLNPLARRYFLAPPAASGFSGRGTPGRNPPGTGRPAGGRDRGAFELRIADGIVKSARFSAYGCPHTLAVAAWLCEVLEGCAARCRYPRDSRRLGPTSSKSRPRNSAGC